MWLSLLISCKKNEDLGYNPQTNWVTPEGAEVTIDFSEVLVFPENAVDTSFFLESYNFIGTPGSSGQLEDHFKQSQLIDGLNYTPVDLWMFGPENIEIIDTLTLQTNSNFDIVMYYDNFNPDSLYQVMDAPSNWKHLDSNLYKVDYFDSEVKIQEFRRLYIFLEED